MSDIGKAIELYTLIKERLEKNGVCLNQAEVYRKTIDLMKTCSTVEEAMDKIKHSDLYLAPSVALVKDRILSRMKAASENGFDMVNQVYLEKFEKIAGDSGEIYDGDYEIEAEKKRTEYLNDLDWFRNLYQKYLEHIYRNDRLVTDRRVADVKDIPMYRALCPCTDGAYERFIKTVSGEASEEEKMKPVYSDFSEIKAVKDEILSSGRKYMSDFRTVQVMVYAPDDASGHYTYQEVK